MKSVWKYPVKHGNFKLDMPVGSEILSVALQRDEAMLWALVNPKAKTEKREFLLAGTGHAIGDKGHFLVFIGTVIMMEGALVWHVFEVKGSV